MSEYETPLEQLMESPEQTQQQMMQQQLGGGMPTMAQAFGM